MRSVLHELSRIGEGGREYVSPMSEEEEEKEEEEENIPQSKQGKSILPASSICIVCFLFLFPSSSSLFRLRKE